MRSHLWAAMKRDNFITFVLFANALLWVLILIILHHIQEACLSP